MSAVTSANKYVYRLRFAIIILTAFYIMYSCIVEEVLMELRDVKFLLIFCPSIFPHVRYAYVTKLYRKMENFNLCIVKCRHSCRTISRNVKGEQNDNNKKLKRKLKDSVRIMK